jgi:hypothetical protein
MPDYIQVLACLPQAGNDPFGIWTRFIPLTFILIGDMNIFKRKLAQNQIRLNEKE